MRALTAADADLLHGARRWPPGSEDAFTRRVALTARGCMVRTNHPDGGVSFTTTPLGRLALRVAVAAPGLVLP